MSAGGSVHDESNEDDEDKVDFGVGWAGLLGGSWIYLWMLVKKRVLLSVHTGWDECE